MGYKVKDINRTILIPKGSRLMITYRNEGKIVNHIDYVKTYEEEQTLKLTDILELAGTHPSFSVGLYTDESEKSISISQNRIHLLSVRDYELYYVNMEVTKSIGGEE